MLTDLSTKKVTAFFQQYSMLRYKKRDMILHANDISSSVFFIKSGYIRVFRISEQGEELTLTILKPNDFFPLTYGLTSMQNPYYLEAITPLEFWRAPKEQFITFIKADPDVYLELTTGLLVRLDGALTRMEYLVFSNAHTKVAATLLVCAKRLGEIIGEDDMIVKVPLTHKDIATLVGITRETTSLEMKKLEKAGYIKRDGKYLIIKNLKRFEREFLLTDGEKSSTLYSL